MIADLALLLSLRWQMVWNTFRLRSARRKALYVAGYLLFVLFLGGMSAGVGMGLGALLRHFPGSGLEGLLPGFILTGVALLLLLGSLGIALSSLFLSNDLQLLMSAPVDRRAVFISKILDGMAMYYLFAVLAAAPALVTYGIGLGYGPLYYLLAIMAIIGTPLLPAGFGALVVMVLARFIPARRLREVLGLVAALFGGVAAVLGNTWRMWWPQTEAPGGNINHDINVTIDQNNINAIIGQLQDIADLPIPSLLAGRGLAAAGVGNLGPALLDLSSFLIVTFGFFAGCVLLADSLYAAGWVRQQSGSRSERHKPRQSRKALRDRLLGIAPAPLAIAVKDWLIIPRDLRNLEQFITPLIMLPIFYFTALSSDESEGGDLSSQLDSFFQGHFDPANIAIAAGIMMMMALMFSRMAATSISMEGKNWWVLKSAPISGRELLIGKLLLAEIPFAVASTVLLIGVALWRGFSLAGFFYGWFGIMLLGSGMLAVASGLAVPWARLDWDTPQRMSSRWGGWLALVISGLLALVGGTLLAAPVAVHILLPSLALYAWIIAPLMAAAITIIIAGLALSFGLSRLADIGEA